MIVQKSLVTSKFSLSTSRAMDLPPIRVLTVDSNADEFTNAYDEAVRVACFKVKLAEQRQLEEIYGRKAVQRTWKFEIAA